MKTKNRILTATNYTYLEPINATHAKRMGATWGSSSNYINFLIAKDRGDKKSMKASKDLQDTYFTPSIARTKADRKGEYKTKAKKNSAAKKSKSASKKSSASKKKSARPASKSRPKKAHLKAVSAAQSSSSEAAA
jgi:hypothetical protein